MKTGSQRRDYLARKKDMLNKMSDIADSVVSYVSKYSGTDMAQAVIEVYFGRPFHVPLNQCVFPGTNEIDWDRAEENLNIMRNKLLFIRELCK